MKKSLFIMALGAIALTSCSQDEAIEVQKDAISFAAFSDNASRADITTTNSIENFRVYGVHYDGTPTTYTSYIDGLECERATTGTSWVNHDSGYYWPMGTMDFYAVSPSTNTITMGTLGAVASNEAQIKDYVITDAATGNNEDLLYAVTVGETKKADDVQLNFKHALSQIAFNVKVANDFTQSVTLEVKSISIVNVLNKGTFAYPKAATTTSESATADLLWTPALDALAKKYTITPTSYTVAYSKGTAAEGGETASMLLMPQLIGASTVGTWNDGSHFILDVDIKDTATGIYLVKDEPTYVPFDIDWRQGVKYVYTFTYSNTGNGGVDDEGKDQLYKIKFACAVSEFAVTDPAETPVPVE